MKSYNEETIKLLNDSILLDEFDDVLQNKTAYEGRISGGDVLKGIVKRVGYNLTGPLTLLNTGAGSYDIAKIWKGIPLNNIFDLEPCPQRKTDSALEGWCENIPLGSKAVDVILCWGVLCFVRSLPETLVQFNRVLTPGGFLIVDTVSYTTMPLPQTCHPESFVRYASMFGFNLFEMNPFGPNHHRRVGFLFRKDEEFNPARMRMPQSTGEIKNYLPERDWYLK